MREYIGVVLRDSHVCLDSKVSRPSKVLGFKEAKTFAETCLGLRGLSACPGCLKSRIGMPGPSSAHEVVSWPKNHEEPKQGLHRSPG